VGEAAFALAWLLLTTTVLLSGPLPALLLTEDVTALSPSMAQAVEAIRFALGLLGLAALAASSSPRLRARSVGLSRGAAAVCLIAALAALLTAEGALRFVNWRRWGSLTSRPRSLDSSAGDRFAPRPGLYGEMVQSDFASDPPRVVTFQINRYGLRGLLPALPRPAGLKRVICIGGSSTFASTVSDGEDFPAQLGRLLAPRVEVLNAGRPGSTTFRDHAYLRDRLLQMQPSAILLYEGFNDMWRGVRQSAGDQKDYGLVAADLLPVPDALDLGEPSRNPRFVSFLTATLGQRLKLWLDRKPKSARATPRPEFHFQPGIVALYDANLRAMIHLARARGVVPVVATFACAEDPHGPEPERRQRLKYALDRMPELDLGSLEEGIELYREVTRKVAHEEGAPLVDLARLVPPDPALFMDTIHFSPRGERRMAEVLAAELPPFLASAP
jgi:lysophospholipase L1-like esterase